MKKLKQFLIDSIYFFTFKWVTKPKVPRNSKILIIFLAKDAQNRILSPLGEFIIREPFFRILKKNKNNLVLLTKKDSLITKIPIIEYFDKIIGLEDLESSEYFDYTLLLQNYLDLPWPILKNKSCFIYSYSFPEIFLNPRLWFKINYFPRYYLGRRHELQRCFDTLNINIKKTCSIPKIKKYFKQKNYITLVVMDKHNPKFSLEHSIEQIEKILVKSSLEVILIGDQNSFSTSKEIEEMINSKRVINLVGKTDSNQLLKVVGESKMVYTPDTGTAHLASALNKKVSVYYLKTDPFRWKPLGGRVKQIFLDPKA